MVKVGNLKLTENQKKRTFHLPVEQAVIVPSTSGVNSQSNISKSQLDTRVNNVRRFLSDKFGGYTSVKATGGFVLKDGKLVKEKVVRVTSFATKKSFDKNRSKVIKQVGAWGNKWKQEAVSYEHEGDLFIITPPKVKRTIVKRTTQQKKVMLSNLVKARRIKAKNL